MEEKRESGIMYRSFVEAGRFLTDEQRGKYYTLIFDHMFEFTIGQSDDPVVNAMFMLVSPQIQANIRKYKNGKEPKVKQNESKTEAKQKQCKSKTEGNVNDNVNVYDNDNKNEKEHSRQDNLFDLSDDDRIIIDYLGRYSKDPNGQYKLLKDYCKVNGITKTIIVGKETIDRDGDIPLIVNKKEDRIDYVYIHSIISSILAWESGGNKIKNGLQTIYTFITKNKGKQQNK